MGHSFPASGGLQSALTESHSANRVPQSTCHDAVGRQHSLMRSIRKTKHNIHMWDWLLHRRVPATSWAMGLWCSVVHLYCFITSPAFTATYRSMNDGWNINKCKRSRRGWNNLKLCADKHSHLSPASTRNCSVAAQRIYSSTTFPGAHGLCI